EDALRAQLETGRLAEPYRDALYAAARDNAPAYAARYLHYYRRSAQNPEAPRPEIREEYERAALRAIRDYRQVYRASSEPYRGRYAPTPERRQTSHSKPERQRPEPRIGEHRDIPDTKGDTHTPDYTKVVTPTPHEEATGRRRREAVVGTKPDRKTTDSTGRVQWRQGKFWIMVEPPPTEGKRQRNVYYSRRPFWGVRKVKGSPEETFAHQGNPPKWFRYDMGITHADIFARETPHLRYRRTSAASRGRRRGRGRLI
ncbi:MAG: hypothetical protein M0R22_07320, partial [Dehalococcoidia bacterium]|nr:hypothetical protein [Dehalococcoidia bacterium]